MRVRTDRCVSSMLEMQPGFVAGGERIRFELCAFEPAQPIVNQGADFLHGQPLVRGGIFFEVCVGQFEQGGGGAEPVLFQMDESARQLDEPFVEGAVRPVPLREPKLLQDIVSLKIELAVEALEIAKVMGVQGLSLEL